MDQLGQRVDVGTEQLLQSAIFQQLPDDRVFGTKLLENLLAGAVAATLGLFCLIVEFQVIEENLTDLPGRVDVETFSRQLDDLPLQLVHGCRQLDGGLLKCGGVERDAGRFHLGEDIDQRHLDRVEQLMHAGLLDLRGELVPET